MKQLLFVLVSVAIYGTLEAANCARPNLNRANVYIYSSIGKVPVRVSRCLFNDTKDAYSDISDNCVKAFQSGTFIDKWQDKNILAEKGSPIVLEEYVSKADLVKNEISLRTGKICRYDRGFCYDPTETNTYAVVWEILDKSKVQCPNQLFKVFQGDVDFWEFKQQGLNYLFHYDALEDKAFYLSLENRAQCQDTDVWYTEEGYIVSTKPLKSKDMESKGLALRTKGGVKGGVKGGAIKAGASVSHDYFTVRTKKIVSENILKHCDIKSLSFEELIEAVDSDYLQNPHNLHLILERYYNLIMDTKQEVIELIYKESTVNITKELKQQLIILQELLEKTRVEVTQIQETLLAAGDLKGIRIDVDTLAKQIALLLKTNEHYDEIIKEIYESIKKNTVLINDQSKEITTLYEKVEKIQQIINTQLPEFITKQEVYEKITQIEQDFHGKLRDLAMNVTMLIMEGGGGGSGGVRGGPKAKEELEGLVLEKLKTFKLDELESKIDRLSEKIQLELNQYRHESYSNSTLLEERILKKLADLEAKNKPILDRLNKYEEQINNLFSEVSVIKETAEHFKESVEKVFKEFDSKHESILKTFEDYDKLINQVRSDLKVLSEKEIDFTPAIEKAKQLLQEALRSRDIRLETLETLAVKLGDSVEKSEHEFDNVENQIKGLQESLSRIDRVKEEISEVIDRKSAQCEKNLSELKEIVEQISAKRDQTDKDLQASKEASKTRIDGVYEECRSSIEHINATLGEDRKLIDQIQSEDTRINGVIDNLRKEIGGHKDSISKLESLITEKSFACEAKGKQNRELIDELKKKVTELYEIVKKQEDLILELKKIN